MYEVWYKSDAVFPYGYRAVYNSLEEAEAQVEVDIAQGSRIVDEIRKVDEVSLVPDATLGDRREFRRSGKRVE